MAPDNDGRESGKLTIKDAYVLDEVYGDNPEVTVIDDIPITNASAGQIRENGNEGEFLASSYHGDPATDRAEPAGGGGRRGGARSGETPTPTRGRASAC